jgi:uncharacterized protein (TIGR03083 family)
MEITEHIAAIEAEGGLLADAAVEAGLFASVPACPAWQVRDLVRHLAYVHSWAARHIAEQAPEVIDEVDQDAILGGGPPDDELIGAYRVGLAALVKTLRDADPDVAYATFLAAESPKAFWCRRQAHETAIHRFDVQAARRSGPPSPADSFGPDFAADGIDELVMGFAARQKKSGPGRSLLVRAPDAGAAWHYAWPADGRVVARRVAESDLAAAGADADCLLSGPASGVYLFLWNRCSDADAGITVSGDPGILEAWNGGVRIRW